VVGGGGVGGGMVEFCFLGCVVVWLGGGGGCVLVGGPWLFFIHQNLC